MGYAAGTVSINKIPAAKRAARIPTQMKSTGSIARSSGRQKTDGVDRMKSVQRMG